MEFLKIKQGELLEKSQGDFLENSQKNIKRSLRIIREKNTERPSESEILE